MDNYSLLVISLLLRLGVCAYAFLWLMYEFTFT